MDEAKKIIAQSVESGDYFEDAKDWYAGKYLFPSVQKAYFLITGIFIIIFGAIMFELAVLTYSKIKYPFPIYVDDQITYFPKIKSLTGKTEISIAVAIANYFVGQYVLTREGYNYQWFQDQDWEFMLLKIRSMSSRKVFSGYMDYIDTQTNVDSPIIKYQNRIKRVITIDKILFPDDQSTTPGMATVYFTAKEIADRELTSTPYKADLHFVISNIDSVADKQTQLQFTVTKYDVTEVKVK